MTGPRTRRGDRHAVVPDVDLRTYEHQPILHQPVWTVEVPWYFFTGGLAGASSALAAALRWGGDDRLAVIAERVAVCGALASPPLLISDLGRPERFLNMLRVFKPTSPMSVGSWILAGYAPAAVAAALPGGGDRWGRPRAVAGGVAAVLGPALATYTAVLVADTAVPVWHEAGRQLPFVFAGSALASAGAAVTGLGAPGDSGPARLALALGAALELGAVEVMERRLGPLAEPYHAGAAHRYAVAAKASTALGAVVALTAGRRRRSAACAGAAAVLAGSLCERFAVFKAGFASAADPQATIGPQRRRRERADGTATGDPSRSNTMTGGWPASARPVPTDVL